MPAAAVAVMVSWVSEHSSFRWYANPPHTDPSRGVFPEWMILPQESGAVGGLLCTCGVDRMAPRRKASRLLSSVDSAGGPSVPRPPEPKDYINELSHEVLCHIFR